jgi:16S rRNA (adenine1518-N6/adenine1519-N6)-dimethyltransferase
MFQKKSLGQNFLNNKFVLEKIAVTGSVSKTDTVLEIGPGKGSLTQTLLDTGTTVVAVEKDDRLIPILNETFEQAVSDKKLILIHGDIEKLDTTDLGLDKKPYKLIANIPYYITGLIIRKFLEEAQPPTEIVIMIQKEVAQRIIARDAKESLLSVSVKAYGIPKNAGVVKAGNFIPKPKVDSAILHIANISKDYFTENKISEDFFFQIAKAGFSGKRKVLTNNLAKFIDKDRLGDILIKQNLNPKIRAEDLTLQNWADIIKEISK